LIRFHQEELRKKWGLPVPKPETAAEAVETGTSQDAEAEIEKLVRDLKKAGLQEKDDAQAQGAPDEKL
jgi:predicted DNA-binding WGR domain protein